MELDIKNIFVSLNADQSKIGNCVLGANNIGNLIKKVDKWKNNEIEVETLVDIVGKYKRKFKTKYNGHSNKYDMIYDLSGNDKPDYKPYIIVQELFDNYSW